MPLPFQVTSCWQFLLAHSEPTHKVWVTFSQCSPVKGVDCQNCSELFQHWLGCSANKALYNSELRALQQDTCPSDRSPQANDSHLPGFSQHASFISFIKDRDFPTPLLSLFIVTKWFGKIFCLAVYKVPVHILWYLATAQSPVSWSEPQKEVRHCNSINSSLLKAEHQTQANLFCWHNKLQTPGLLFFNQKPNQILLVNMTWLLTGPERKHFSPLVIQASWAHCLNPDTGKCWYRPDILFCWGGVLSPLK